MGEVIINHQSTIQRVDQRLEFWSHDVGTRTRPAEYGSGPYNVRPLESPFGALTGRRRQPYTRRRRYDAQP